MQLVTLNFYSLFSGRVERSAGYRRVSVCPTVTPSNEGFLVKVGRRQWKSALIVAAVLIKRPSLDGRRNGAMHTLPRHPLHE